MHRMAWHGILLLLLLRGGGGGSGLDPHLQSKIPVTSDHQAKSIRQAQF